MTICNVLLEPPALLSIHRSLPDIQIMRRERKGAGGLCCLLGECAPLKHTREYAILSLERTHPQRGGTQLPNSCPVTHRRGCRQRDIPAPPETVEGRLPHRRKPEQKLPGDLSPHLLSVVRKFLVMPERDGVDCSYSKKKAETDSHRRMTIWNLFFFLSD